MSLELEDLPTPSAAEDAAADAAAIAAPPSAPGKLAALYARISGRNRAILHFFATSILSRGVSISCQLLQVPIALHYLGSEAFGLWITFSGFSYLLTVADFGIGLGAQNQIAEAHAVGDARRARRVFCTASVTLAGIGLALMAIIVPLCLALPWERFLKLTEPRVLDQVNLCAALVAVLCCLGIATSMGTRLAYALQLSWLTNVQTTLSNVLSLTAIIVGCQQHATLLVLFAVVFVPGLFVSLALTAYLLRRTGWLNTARSGAFTRREVFDPSLLRGLTGVGALFFVQQLCDMSLYTIPSILISSLLGAASVVPYNIGQRLFSLFLVIQNAFLPPLWPAYAEAKALRDWAWVRRTLRRSMLATLGLTIGPMTVAVIFGGTILRLWIGRKEDPANLPASGLLWLLFAWNAIVVLQQPFAFLLSGMSVVRRLSYYRIATAVCSIGSMLLLGPMLGLPGIVLGLIAAMLISLLGGVLETQRFLRSAESQTPAPAPAGSADLLAAAP